MNISATERIHRELLRPQAQPPNPTRATADPKPIALTRADVVAILQRTRGATTEDLEFLISHSKEFSLTDGQRDQLCCDLTITAAQRARQGNGRRIDANAEFIGKVLGLCETPWGLIEREWINAQLQAGSQAIQRCKSHRPPFCRCWSASRAILWQARASGEKTPEGWAAVRIYSFLEELELASRPEIEQAMRQS